MTQVNANTNTIIASILKWPGSTENLFASPSLRVSVSNPSPGHSRRSPPPVSNIG